MTPFVIILSITPLVFMGLGCVMGSAWVGHIKNGPLTNPRLLGLGRGVITCLENSLLKWKLTI